MRALIRAAIIGDATLAGLGVIPEAVLAGDVDTPAERPFVNLKWGVRSPGMSIVSRHQLTIWVHDQPNDYDRIDAICHRLRYLLEAIEASAWSQGDRAGHVDQVTWTGDSSDLSDTGHGTITKQSNYEVIGSEGQ